MKLNAYFCDSLPSSFQTLLSDPEKIIQSAELIKDDKSTTVVKFVHDEKYYILKRFNARSNGHKVKRALRQTRASRCWQMSLIFQQHGINVPKPIAKLEYRYGIIKGDSYFVSEYVKGDELLEWLPKQQGELVELVGDEIKKVFDIFYQNRLSHGDMKATNLLWSEQQLFLIDLDVAKRHFLPITFFKANVRDKKRFRRNGEIFAKLSLK